MAKNLVKIYNSVVYKSIIRGRKNYLTEKNVLNLLYANYTDYFNVNYYPFPRLLSYNDDELKLTLSYCGVSLDKTSNVSIRDRDNCIKNILYNIKNNNINKIDLKRDNICIMDNYVYLIDYDKVILNDKLNYIAEYHLFNYLIDKKTGETGLTG
jgi:predicted Ser/Thr protein kinase